jgi:hypothetical protein
MDDIMSCVAVSRYLNEVLKVRTESAMTPPPSQICQSGKYRRA